MQLPSAHHDQHPRPLLQRDAWRSLDGHWSFTLDDEMQWDTPTEVEWTGATIAVPFAVETEASGIADKDFHQRCWYRRVVHVTGEGGRTVLHFQAVDYVATVFVDGTEIGRHEGAYSPFSFDLTAAGFTEGPHELVVRVDDDAHDLDKPRGKQDWELTPHSIFYERTTGIWQTVWTEDLPTSSIMNLRCNARFEDGTITVSGEVIDAPRGSIVEVAFTHTGATLTIGRAVVEDGSFELAVDVAAHRDLRWTPETPNLIDVEAVLSAAGSRLDTVRSYCAFRSVAIEDGRFILNGEPYYLRMVLDQGYWPTSGLTAPDDSALRADVELAKELGFNGVRKHQKIEDERYLYWADRLGLMVWVELPSARRYSPLAEGRAFEQWPPIMRRDLGHPSVVAWMTFNESWGIQQVATHASQQNFVRKMYELTRQIDTSRPVIGNDGWENLGGDIIGVHDYRQDPSLMLADYTVESLPAFLHRGLPEVNGKMMCLDDPSTEAQSFGGDRCVMATELGGVGFTGRVVVGLEHPTLVHSEASQQAWGYAATDDAADFAARYRALMSVLGTVDGLWGFCYTQLTDTYQEVNGLLNFDRTSKVPVNIIRRATAAVWPGSTLAERQAAKSGRSVSAQH